MSHNSVYFTVSGTGGKHGVKEIKRELDRLPGVMSVSVNSRGEQVAVDFDTTGATQNQIRDQLERLGYSIESIDTERLTD